VKGSVSRIPCAPSGSNQPTSLITERNEELDTAMYPKITGADHLEIILIELQFKK
jgi:hypothetical protein